MNTTQDPTINPNTATPTTDPAQLTERIARLPKETRDMINAMLDDRLPYHILIEELGETGEGLKPQNLADWVQGRYQDYLKGRHNIEHAKSQMEFAADLLRELGDADPALIYRACHAVAALQVFNAISEYGDEALTDMLRADPATYLGLLNSLCNLSNTQLKREQQKPAG
jgi:hypothetical protein